MVSVLIVTWNSAQYLEQCFASLDRQDYRELEVVVVDNASTDGTRELLRPRESQWQVIYNDRNVGFAAGQNQAMRAAKGEWLLCLNPDVMLAADFVGRLVEAGSAHPEAGSICGKLLRWNPASEPHQTRIIDSTGIYFTRNMRHLDRGAEEVDNGQYDRAQYVFGATGAAAMFRRSFVEAVSVDGEFFDEDFFSYREDADLAWRAQVMGWKCLYTPVGSRLARAARHARTARAAAAAHQLALGEESLPDARQECFRLAMLAAVLAGGMARPDDSRLCRGARPPIAVGARLSRGESSAAFAASGPIIQSRRKVSDRDLIWWFSDTPRAIDEVGPSLMGTFRPAVSLPGKSAISEDRP